MIPAPEQPESARTPVAPEFERKRPPNSPVFDFLFRQILGKPVQEKQARRMTFSCSLTRQHTRTKVLPVAVPALTRCEYGCVEADLRAKNLIFIFTPKGLFESTNPLDDATSHHDAGWHGRLVAQKKRKKPRRLNDRVRRHAELFHIIAFAIFRVPCPAIPIFVGPVGHGGFGISLK